jgi:DNA-binding response OmpR family regulator
MRILVVEDDAVVRTFVTAGLRAGGHEVHAYSTGTDGWEEFRQKPYPIVVTDWMMPGMDGLELTRMIRRMPQPGYSYVIMLTAKAKREHYIEAVKAGVDSFLVKPLDGAILEAEVHIAERILSREAYTKRLEAIMTVCTLCKRVSHKGQWVPMEKYVAEEFKAQPARVYCDDCMTDRVEPELRKLGITTKGS